MSQYNFDELVKKATHGKDTYCDKTTPISKTEAIKDILNSYITINISDGQSIENGGQFEYMLNCKELTWECINWRIPGEKCKGTLNKTVIDNFAKSVAFILQLPQKQFVTNTKSSGINTNPWDRKKYGPIQRLSRCELRIGDKFLRFIPEQDSDSPFSTIYAAISELRNHIG